MARGDTFRAATQTAPDPRTGILVRQVTDFPAIHHHPFFIVPAYDDAQRWLFFVSHRSGAPQILGERLDEGVVIQLTDRLDLDEWSIHPAHDGRFVYYTAAGAGWRVDLETLTEEELIRFPEVEQRRVGGVAGEMGTTALSWDDRWWAVHYKEGSEKALAIVDTQTGQHEVIVRRATIGHLQFCPDDSQLLAYAGPHAARLWIVNRDGTGHRPLFEQQPMQWLTHEIWIPGTRELAVVDWPHGVFALQVLTGETRRVATFNAWHIAIDRQGERLVADTNCPDIGIQMCNCRDGIGRTQTVCFPEASNAGSHWAGRFPYSQGPIKVYAPQHTHPHPSFSPDGRRVVYTSDRSGHAQVYEALLDGIVR